MQSINKQQMIEIDELYDEIWKLDEVIEDLKKHGLEELQKR